MKHRTNGTSLKLPCYCLRPEKNEKLKYGNIKSSSSQFIVTTNSRPIRRTATRLPLKRKISGSNFEPVRSDLLLLTACYRCDVFPEKAVLPGTNDTKVSPTTPYAFWRNTACIMKDLIANTLK